MIEDNYILNIILIIDDNYNAYKETDVVIVNDKINDIEKERLTDINYIYGNTLTSSQDGMKNMAILLSFLMLLPLIFITIISLFIINILFNKTINEDKIKKKFYLKTKYLTEDYIIDYLLVYLIPMLIGLFISYLLVYLLNYQLFISIYIISIIFSLFVLLVFIKIRKKKLRMC